MCIGNLFRMPKPKDPKLPQPSRPAPAANPIQKSPVTPPKLPDKGPIDVAKAKKEAAVSTKKIDKKRISKGTSQLKVNKPETGGLNTGGGTGTGSGTNTGGGTP